MGDRSDTFGWNSIIGNSFVIANDSVYRDGVVIKSLHVGMRHNVVRNSHITEVFCGNKSVATGWESKIKAKTDGMASVIEAQARMEPCHRR
jgi:hypothetical protein